MKIMCEKLTDILDAHKLFLTFNENKKIWREISIKQINIMGFDF